MNREQAEVEVLSSQMIAESATEIQFNRYNEKSSSFAKRFTQKHPKTDDAENSLKADDYVLCSDEIIQAFENIRDPLVPFSVAVTKAEVDEKLRSLTNVERDAIYHECDVLLGSEVPVPTSERSSEVQPNRNPVDSNAEVGSGFDFVGRPTLQVFHHETESHGSSHNFQRESFNFGGDSDAHLHSATEQHPTTDASTEQVRKNMEIAHEVFLRQRVAETIREEKLKERIKSALFDRLKKVIMDETQKKKAALNTLITELKEEVNEMTELVGVLPQITEEAAVQGVDQRATILWNHNTSECQICDKVFCLYIRRHHCRRCGKCVCNSCASAIGCLPMRTGVTEVTPSEGRYERLCSKCYEVCAKAQEEKFSTLDEAKFFDQTVDDKLLPDQRVRYYVIPFESLQERIATSPFLLVGAHHSVEVAGNGVIAVANMLYSGATWTWQQLSERLRGST